MMDTEIAERRYVVSNTTVSVRGPAEFIRILDSTMLHVTAHCGTCEVDLWVERGNDSWTVSDVTSVISRLEGTIAMPEVAGALTTALVERIALYTKAVLVSGVIVARDEFAVALVGDDWGSCIAIAAHLSLRGWRIVTPRYAFVDPDTRVVEPFSKLLYFPSRIIPLLPLGYRRALEASPWYSKGSELGFYAVDPLNAGMPSTWGVTPTLRAALIVDSSRTDLLGLVQSPAHTYIGAFLPFSGIGIATASLIVGQIVPTTDAVEQWVESLLWVA